MLKVVAYYTNDFYYGKSIDLSHSLNKYGVSYEVSKIKGPATWQEAVSYKPRFILDSLVNSTCQQLIYTDADSKLLRPMPVDVLRGELAYVPFKRSPQHEEETLTGTLYFKNTMAVKAMILAWIEATAKYQHTFTPEQHGLREVLEHCGLEVQRLGPEWCWIYDDFKELFPNAPPPIFEHYQASREYKELERKKEAPAVQDLQINPLQREVGSEWKAARG